MAYLSGTVDSVEDSLVVDSLARRDGRFAALFDSVEELSDLPVEHALLGLFEHRDDVSTSASPMFLYIFSGASMLPQ